MFFSETVAASHIRELPEPVATKEATSKDDGDCFPSCLRPHPYEERRTSLYMCFFILR